MTGGPRGCAGVPHRTELSAKSLTAGKHVGREVSERRDVISQVRESRALILENRGDVFIHTNHPVGSIHDALA